MSAADLWTAVVAAYPSDALIQLTNLENRAATTVDTTFGQRAAQAVIDLWPLYAQTAYDATDATHVEVASFGVIAELYRRGGSSTRVAEVKWDDVFGDNGMLAKVRKTGPRGHALPVSNSTTQQSDFTDAGSTTRRPWADRRSLPPSYLPRTSGANDDPEDY